MRSARELIFRARQELANVRLWAVPPATTATDGPDPSKLSAVSPIVRELQSTSFCTEVIALAESVLDHRIPMGSGVIETGPRIDWRKDYRSGSSSDLNYVRFIPYLDFSRVGDHKVIWDLNRHHHLVVLAQAFLMTGRAEFMDELEAELDSWLADNPYMRGINWTSALEAGFRALSWTWILHLVGHRLPEDLRRRLLRSLYHHGCYLEANLSIYFSPNTHLLGEAVALHALGVLFPGFPRADHWRVTGNQLVLDQMGKQVRPDGSHFEQSTYYHVYALDFFLFHQMLADTTKEFRSGLHRMADYLHAVMGKSRLLPLIGDDDGGRVFHPFGPGNRFGRASLATCAMLFDETRWAYDTADLYSQAVWWLGAGVLSRAPSSPGAISSSRLFVDAGVGVLTAIDMDVVVDAGPFGPGGAGHSHSDTLSIVVRSGDTEILIDPGTFTYVANPGLRDELRGSASHNTIRIDQMDQAVPAGTFRWQLTPEVDVLEWITTSGYDLIRARCRYRHAPFVHGRQVLLLKTLRDELDIGCTALVVRDEIQGPPGTHRVEQFWHPASFNTPRLLGNKTSLLFPTDEDEVVVIPGSRSPSFGEIVPARVIAIKRVVSLPTSLWACLVVGESHETAALARLSADSCRLTLQGDRRVEVNLAAVERVRYSGANRQLSAQERDPRR